MVDSADPTGRALEPARSATPATVRRKTALAAVARPAAEVAGLLLAEVLGNPRARPAALGLARSLTHWLAGRRPPASAGVEVTTRQVTLVLVAHSNAGLFIPVIAAALPSQVLGCIFVDAALPSASGAVPVVPPELLALLRDKASGGLLPRWTDWWDEAEVARCSLTKPPARW